MTRQVKMNLRTLYAGALLSSGALIGIGMHYSNTPIEQPLIEKPTTTTLTPTITHNVGLDKPEVIFEDDSGQMYMLRCSDSPVNGYESITRTYLEPFN